MDLRHQFSVPLGVPEAWAHFQDIASVATCFPGAQVTSVEDDSFAGQVKVKLGPVALVYTGQGRFVEKDEDAHRFVVEAKGRDKRGNGTAGATVVLTMSEQGPESTGVEVVTDLAVTGRPAQFGRGVMQDVSDKLLGQFTACLERQVRSGGSSEAAAPSPEPATGATTAPGERGDALAGAAPDTAGESTPLAAASASAGGGGLLAAAGAPSASPAAAAPSTSSASTGREGEPPVASAGAAGGGGLLAAAGAPPVSAAATGSPVAEPAEPTSGGSPGSASPTSGGAPGSSAAASGGPAPDADADALDLGATVLPVLAKAYWKQAVGLVVVVLVLRKILGGSR